MSFLLAANWKMHKSPQETRAFFSELKSHKLPSGIDLVFFVPSLNAEATSQAQAGQSWAWGPQNIYPESHGAFTGETSPSVVKELGANWVLIGHSERRQLFHESDELINRKVHAALKLKMTPCLCVGETLEQRKAGITLSVIQSQLEGGLAQVNSASHFVVAYEPVWAIGTGEVATPQQVQEVHHSIHQWILSAFSAQARPILYGGSVKPENAAELSQIPEVQGFLVGGASLQVTSLLSIAAQVRR